jgi:5-methylcytosine-specific restriction endonuclease McrA
MPLQIEHIKPLVAGGTSERNNLWPACPLCNGHKASRTHAPDPITGLETTLFNPREQKWDEHFQ